MDEELEVFRKRKMMEMLNRTRREEQKPLLITIFDLLLPAVSCGPGGCGPSGCGPNIMSENITELEVLARNLITKHGRDRIRFELVNVLDASMQNYRDAYEILRDKKGEALPIISINGEIKFVGRVPTFEEIDQEIKVVT